MGRQNAPTGQVIPTPNNEATGRPLLVQAEPLPAGPTAVRVVGRVDQQTAPLLERRLLEEARNCRIQPARLLLNLDRVTYLDRAGLEALLRASSRLASGFATVELADPSPNIIRLLHEANLDGASWMSNGG